MRAMILVRGCYFLRGVGGASVITLKHAASAAFHVPLVTYVPSGRRQQPSAMFSLGHFGQSKMPLSTRKGEIVLIPTPAGWCLPSTSKSPIMHICTMLGPYRPMRPSCEDLVASSMAFCFAAAHVSP